MRTKQGVQGFEWSDVSQFEKILPTLKLKLLSNLLCTLPGQRWAPPKTVNGLVQEGSREGPGRVQGGHI